ncbi:MAG: class I SAM-dependent methyltransferase [Beijerinckiaceae bacterium]|jgi:SAM-dependent methyltransferase
MIGEQARSKGTRYWDLAGEQGYAQAMYRSSDVESHVRGRLWRIAIEIAEILNIPPDAQVLEVGCGAFANQVLTSYYRQVIGIDISEKAVRRAQLEARENTTFEAIDLISFDYSLLPEFEAAFLIGILHHAKYATPNILKALVKKTSKMIVLEPNGNHLLRKLLEFTPSYRAAGEHSFRRRELLALYEAAGWQVVTAKRLNLFPNFTPGPAYRSLAPIKSKIERSRFWSLLCTVDLYGLKARAARLLPCWLRISA